MLGSCIINLHELDGQALSYILLGRLVQQLVGFYLDRLLSLFYFTRLPSSRLVLASLHVGSMCCFLARILIVSVLVRLWLGSFLRTPRFLFENTSVVDIIKGTPAAAPSPQKSCGNLTAQASSTSCGIHCGVFTWPHCFRIGPCPQRSRVESWREARATSWVSRRPDGLS